MFLLLGLLGYTIYHTALNYGEINVSAGTASLIIATAPAFTTIFSTYFLGEYLTVLGWCGIFLSFFGVILIVLGENTEFSFNIFALLILLSAVAYALYQTLQRRLLTSYSAVEVTAFATWAGTIPLFIFSPGFTQAISIASPNSLWAGVYLGVFPSAIAYSLLAYVVSNLPMTLVASILYSVPVFSLLFSRLFLGEIPSWLTGLGGVIVLIGIVVVRQSKLSK